MNIARGAALSHSILLFEDDADIRRLVAELLKEQGYTVYPASSLEQAGVIADTVEVGLVLADTAGTNREHAIRNLRRYCEQIGPKAPVIVFTAHDISLEDARGIGCADVLTKPFDIDELLRRVGQHLK